MEYSIGWRSGGRILAPIIIPFARLTWVFRYLPRLALAGLLTSTHLRSSAGPDVGQAEARVGQGLQDARHPVESS